MGSSFDGCFLLISRGFPKLAHIQEAVVRELLHRGIDAHDAEGGKVGSWEKLLLVHPAHFSRLLSVLIQAESSLSSSTTP